MVSACLLLAKVDDILNKKLSAFAVKFGVCVKTKSLVVEEFICCNLSKSLLIVWVESKLLMEITLLALGATAGVFNKPFKL
jgi:hypothetical protein